MYLELSEDDDEEDEMQLEKKGKRKKRTVICNKCGGKDHYQKTC